MRRAWSFDAAKSARFCRAHLQPIKNRSRERHSVHKNRRLGGHEEQKDTSVHEMRRFCGYEQQNDDNFQEKGCFLGYEGEFDVYFQEKRHFLGRQDGEIKKVCDMHTIAGRFSAASSASARLLKKVEAAVTPDPSKASGRCAPDRGCLSEAKTGVKIVERNKGWLIANPCFFLAEALNYLFKAVATSTAQATVQPTIGLLPMPRNPIISTCAGTDDDPANCASECIRPIVSVIPYEAGPAAILSG